MYTSVGQSSLSPQLVAARKNVGTKKDPVAGFGHKIAATILSKIQKVPKDIRQPVLMSTLDAIDPNLFKIVDARLRQLVAQGVGDKEALRRALSAAFSNTLVTDLVDAGESKQVPIDRMLALGTYGELAMHRCIERYDRNMALGMVSFTIAKAANVGLLAPLMTCPPGEAGRSFWRRTRSGEPPGAVCYIQEGTAKRMAQPTGPGACPPGYTFATNYKWVSDCATLPVDETLPPNTSQGWPPICPPGYKSINAVRGRTDPPRPVEWGRCEWAVGRGCKPGFSRRASGKCEPYTPPPARNMSVGPFMFYDNVEEDRSRGYPAGVQLPGKWSFEIRGEGKHFIDPTIGAAGYYASYFGLDKWIGMNAKTKVQKAFFNGTKPLYKFKHPVFGKDYGVFIIATKKSFSAVMKRAPKDKPWYSKLWSGIKRLVAKIVDFVVEVVKDVAGLVCDVISEPAGQLAVGGAAVAMGAPPEAAIMGTQIAAGICASAPPAPAFFPTTGLPGWVLPAAGLAGAALLVALVIKKRKKKRKR